MLPLSYLLYKEKDLTLHVLAPMIAVFTLGYFCQTNNFNFPAHGIMYGPFLGGIYRAGSGLCFGVCAYNIYICLYEADMNSNMRKLLTVLEVFLYGVFFGTWFLIRDNYAVMSVILLLPVAVAITFSGKSYIAGMFQFEWMKCFAPISLTIYLNHWIGRILVERFFSERGYWFCVCMMMLFTLGASLLSICLIRTGKFIWREKVRAVFTSKDTNNIKQYKNDIENIVTK